MMEEEKGCAGTANSATEIQQQEIEERAQQDMLQQVDKEWACRCDREIKAGLLFRVILLPVQTKFGLSTLKFPSRRHEPPVAWQSDA